MYDEYRDLLDFWFSADMRPAWFNSTPEIDSLLCDRYDALWRQACLGELDRWATTPDGALALVILFDQLPLNMYRGRPESFASGQLAVQAAGLALDAGFDARLGDEGRMFLYMPFMHSESMADQDRSVALFSAAGLPTRWAEHHRDIVRRFGRFPHRNAILGRADTPEECDYLTSPNAFRG